MRLLSVLLTLVASRLVLALAVTLVHDTPFRRLRSPIERLRSRHPEPDRTKPQRPFRGGRVRHPMFKGSGCPADSVVVVNASDTSSFALSALFSQFQAQTANETLRDRRTCTITVTLEPTEQMSIGVAHVDFRGSAYVPVGKLPTLARLDASYTLTGGGRSRIANASYAAGYDDQFYEAVDVSDVAWTPCGRGGPTRVYELRISATITASKTSARDSDVAIAVDTSDTGLQKGVYYELTARACGVGGPAKLK